MKSVKVAISLPAEVLEAVDRERRARGVSRSQLFSQAIVAFLVAEQERRDDAQYARAYCEQPEGEDKKALAAFALEWPAKEPRD